MHNEWLVGMHRSSLMAGSHLDQCVYARRLLLQFHIHTAPRIQYHNLLLLTHRRDVNATPTARLDSCLYFTSTRPQRCRPHGGRLHHVVYRRFPVHSILYSSLGSRHLDTYCCHGAAEVGDELGLARSGSFQFLDGCLVQPASIAKQRLACFHKRRGCCCGCLERSTGSCGSRDGIITGYTLPSLLECSARTCELSDKR